MNWIYSGVDRNGNNRSGVISGDQIPADIAQRYWDQGWRSLDLRSDDEERYQAAAIERSPDTGRRMWWGEGRPS